MGQSVSPTMPSHDVPPPWSPDRGDGVYANPVLYADYSDPDVVAVEGDYFLTSSSFNCSPGLPILHSRDLVNWKLVNHALPRLYDVAFDSPQHGNGVWAPSLRYHDGWYYIYWGDADRGIYMVRARNPRGAWSTPTLVKKAYGNIDPCPLWDDDGKIYLVHAFAHSRAGVNSLLTVVELSPDGTKAVDKGWIVFDGHGEHPTIEGPKFYKRNGYYYIFAPAGGVPQGWQLVLRSRRIRGPYEVRTVLAQGSTEVNGPHQGGWVETPQGEFFFVHFQDQEAYGRVVHLQPMTWKDDWPVIGVDPDGDGVGQPIMLGQKPKSATVSEPTAPATSDDFSQSSLGLQWQWHANPKSDWHSLDARRGWLRLSAAERPDAFQNLWDAPNLLLQKFPAREFRCTCRVDASSLQAGDRAGMVVMGLDYAYLAVERTSDDFRIVRRDCLRADRGEKETTIGSRPLPSAEVELRIDVRTGALCRFAFRELNGDWQSLGSEFAAKPGRWIGAKIGLFALAASQAGDDARPSGFLDVNETVFRTLPSELPNGK
ncbi:MAG: glycoside hydrolase 43 family protein [Planctomycetales bacterium]|nr:glycoside hydrolase 43 family protein [Planctomycetales bacterium]